MRLGASHASSRTIQDLQTSVALWQVKCEVVPIQLFQSKVSHTCLQSRIRKKVIEWVFDRCGELETSARTPQFAANLVDLFHAKEPDIDQANLHAVAAAALMITMKIVESIEFSPAYISQLPGVRVSPRTLVELESGLLAMIDWAIDMPTAADIVDILDQPWLGAQFPPRAQWDEFLGSAYRCAAVRAGPLALALTGLWKLAGTRDTGVKLCFELAGMAESEAEALSAEVRLAGNCMETASDSDSTFSSSPDIRR